MIILDGVPFNRVSGIDLMRGPDGEPVLTRPWQDHPNLRGRVLHRHGSGPFAPPEQFGWPRRNPEPGSMRDGRWLVGYGMAGVNYA